MNILTLQKICILKGADLFYVRVYILVHTTSSAPKTWRENGQKKSTISPFFCFCLVYSILQLSRPCGWATATAATAHVLCCGEDELVALQCSSVHYGMFESVNPNLSSVPTTGCIGLLNKEECEMNTAQRWRTLNISGFVIMVGCTFYVGWSNGLKIFLHFILFTLHVKPKICF